MKFHADENVPRPFVQRLRAQGHEVAYVVERVRSLRDATILRAALHEDTLVLTLDKDYRRLVFEEKQPTLGVIWIRLFQMNLKEQTERLAQVIEEQGDGLL